MLVDPASLDLVGVAVELLRDVRRAGAEARDARIAARGRHDARARGGGRDRRAGRGAGAAAELATPYARVPAAGVHPFAAPLGVLNAGERYDTILADYGDVARAQLVCALQVHVAVGSADATLAVYNALRGHLPELAALAANAPFHAGRDTGFASVRPLIGGLLPRQGVPPELGSWAAFAAMLRWGGVRAPRSSREAGGGSCARTSPTGRSRSGSGHADDRRRGRRRRGVRARARRLAARAPRGRRGARRARNVADRREPLDRARHGLDGRLADLVSGEARPVRELLRERLEKLAPVAERIGCAAELAAAHALVERNGSIRLREVAAETDLLGATKWLTDRFLD